MLFTLEPLPASEGDCLLLHWGTKQDPKLAVIDGGPSRTYEDTLRPRLEKIVKNRGLARLPLDLVMISHMDNDHVVGIQKLTRQLKHEIEANIPADKRLLRMDRLWHNVFNDILNDSIDAYYNTLTASLQASVNGQPNGEIVHRLSQEFQNRHNAPAEDAKEDAWDIAKILAGHGEGREVRLNHKYLFDKHEVNQLNRPFQDAHGKPTLITAEKTPTPTEIKELNFTILGPAKAEIEALQKEFDAYIKQKGLTTQALLAAYADKSIKNLSSIVCLAEYKGKRILLTGDARGDKILEGLKKANLLDANDTIKKIDILKVPHHGSDRNVEPKFFDKIIAKTYVFSGNGIHGNPDRETLDWLTEARGKNAEYEIVLTYQTTEIDKNHKLEKARDGKPWSDAKYSVDRLLTQKKNNGYKFKLLTGAQYIDLGDEKVSW